METLFSIVLYLLFGFFGLLFLLFILAALFGKRIKKLWEFEAEFRDHNGREFGEFDFEKSRVEKEESDFRFKARFKMRHESLEEGQIVQVFIEEQLVMQGNVAKAGRVFLGEEAIVDSVGEPEAGQICRVVFGGREQFSAPIKPD